MSFTNIFSEWAKNGSKTAPTESLENTGFTGGMKPPASVFNYMWDKIGKAITELQTAVTGKVSKSQGTDASGKFLTVGTDGNVTTSDNPANSCVLKWQGTAGSGKMLSVGTDGYVELVDKSSIQTTATIGTTWDGDSVPYTQTIEVTGVTATNVVEISLPTNATATQVEAYNLLILQDGGQSENSITLRAFGEKNGVTIPINIIIRRDI